MTTADEAYALLRKARNGDEIQCSPTGVRDPQHYRHLLSIIENEVAENYNLLVSEYEKLKGKYKKLEAFHNELIGQLRQERTENERLKKRLIAATEMAECPPPNANPLVPEAPKTDPVLPKDTAE